MSESGTKAAPGGLAAKPDTGILPSPTGSRSNFRYSASRPTRPTSCTPRGRGLRPSGI
jgi:hypothetical protein